MRRILLAAALTLAATSAFAADACPGGLKQVMTAEVFFGQDREGGANVSDEDWRGFLSAEISPRFPDGLTVSDVYGQRRGPKDAFVREPSKALFIVLAGAPDEQRRLGLIRQAYKLRFNQDSVLLVEQQACARL